MNPEINIRISFADEEGEVIVEKEIGGNKEIIESSGEMKAPSLDEESAADSLMIADVPTAEVETNGVLAVPEKDDLEEELFSAAVPEAEDDMTDITDIASVPSEENDISVEVPSDEIASIDLTVPVASEDEFFDLEGNIPPIPEHDFSDAVEKQIIAQLDDLDTDIEPTLAQLDVPNGYSGGDLSVSDDQIPPLPEV